MLTNAFDSEPASQDLQFSPDAVSLSNDLHWAFSEAIYHSADEVGFSDFKIEDFPTGLFL